MRKSARRGRFVRSAMVLFVVTAGLVTVAADVATAAGPVVTSISPSSGPVGTTVTIKGSGFPVTGTTVTFSTNVVAPNPTVNAAGTRITVRVPPFAISGPLTVMTATGAAAHAAFTVTGGVATSPKNLWPGQYVRISGSAFPPDQNITLMLDGADFSLGQSDPNGNFSVRQPVARNTPVGHHTITATCAICTVYHVGFGLYDDWPQPRLDSADSADNPLEWALPKSNVGHLGLQYQSETLGLTWTGPIEYHGRVYVGAKGAVDMGIHAFGFSDAGALTLWFGDMAGDVTTPPAVDVDSGTLFTTTGNTLYAYDAAGNKNCTPFHGAILCSPLWTGALFGASASGIVVANGDVIVAGSGGVQGFDAAGKKLCGGSPKVCPDLFHFGAADFGAPAVDPATGDIYVVEHHGTDNVLGKIDPAVSETFSAPIGTYTFSSPAVSAGKVAFTAATNLDTRLFVYDAGTLALSWQGDVKGVVPIAVAMSPTKVFAVNGAAQLLAFKLTGCGSASTCKPIWTSPTQGGSDVPASLANGVVYMGVTTGADGTFETPTAFDEFGTLNCSGTPTVCDPIWTSAQATVTDGTEMAPAAGWLFTAGNAQIDGFKPSA